MIVNDRNHDDDVPAYTHIDMVVDDDDDDDVILS